MLYTIYKITNNINGKFYIGKHQTKNLNDGYMGSGKLISRAILKHGIENFTKEILHVFDNEEEMNDKEKELVILSEDSYNLCEGGKGGFGYINNCLVEKRDKREYKVAGALAANLKHANLKGSETHKKLLLADEVYKQKWYNKVTKSLNKRKRDCPFCNLKNLNDGNFSRHLKSKHPQPKN